MTAAHLSNDFSLPLLFEGIEKKLEIKYSLPSGFGNNEGLRSIDDQKWSNLLNSFGCQILNSISNEIFEAYLLSESSLFVYRDRVILKTCGTTRLLTCLSMLEQYARNVFNGEADIDYVLFTRRNYNYPEKQPSPHTSWDEELEVLNSHFPRGNDFLIGEESGDHFHVFINDYRNIDENVEEYCTLEVAMTDLTRDSMSYFYNDEDFESESQTVQDSGISQFIPEKTEIDARMFNPFGFSLNGILDEAYYTMHITPQPECSYVSFETNRDFKEYNIEKVTKKVIGTFKPENYTAVAIHSRHYRKSFPSNSFEIRNINISPHLTLHFYSYALEKN